MFWFAEREGSAPSRQREAPFFPLKSQVSGLRFPNSPLSLPSLCVILRAMFLLLRVLLLCILAAIPAGAATAPTISTATASPGANGAVTFDAEVTANGALTRVFFEYGKTLAYGKVTAPIFISGDGVDAAVSATVTGLVGGQMFHFRAVARNDADTARTPDGMFTVATYDPVLTIQPATKLKGDLATLRATVTANGTAGTAFFEYSTSGAFDTEVETSTETWMLDGSQEALTLSTEVPGLDRNVTYHFRLVLREPAPGSDFRSTSASFLTNQSPVARADTFHLRSLRAAPLDVRKNDTDPDEDDLLVTATTAAEKGTATRTEDGASVVYEPGPTFRGTDSFSYTIMDPFPSSTASATVTIRSFGILLAGNLGGLLVDESGEPIGYFKISTTDSGAFTGSVLVNGEKESFTGVLGADGTYRGTIEIDGRTVPVSLTATVNGSATSVDVDFDGGRWTAALQTTEASPEQRAALAGRYTVEFPTGSTSGDAANDGATPAGTGWAAMKLGEDGVARVKGRLPDGRSFSTRGLLGIASSGPVVTFFDDPRRTRVAGALTLGTSIGGTLKVARDSGGGGLFSDGYGLESTAAGARYVQPADGKRAIEGAADASGRQLTFAVTGGDPAETFTRTLRVDKDDDARVIDGGDEGLKVKIDRDSGRFTAWFTGSTDDRRIKGTGVFIQGAAGTALGRGAGVFTGENATGKITISAGGGTTTTTPDPTPDPGTVTVRP